MMFVRAVLLCALALSLAQCDTGETPEQAIILPFPLLVQRSSGSAYTIALIRTDRSVIELAEGLSPRWSPNGNRIAFWTTTSAGLNDIYTMDSDGSDLRNLTNSPAIYESRPVWSPNGSMIAFDEEAAGSGKGVGIMTAVGMDRRFVPSKNTYNNAKWFPDAGSLLFQKTVGSRVEIHSVNSDGTTEMTLASDTTKTFTNGSISPNGLYFAYSRSDSSQLIVNAIVIRDIASGHEDEFPGALIGTNWSPQSDWLYCTESSSGGMTIVRISPLGKIKQDLSQKPLGSRYNDIVSSLSSDGNWLAFSSDRSGPSLIYMMNAEGSNKQQVTFDPQLTSPFWKP